MSETQEKPSEKNHGEKREKHEARRLIDQSPCALMEKNYEYMKMLKYEKKVNHIPMFYFAFPYKKNPSEQFRKAIEVLCWILGDVIKLSNFKPPNLYDDPNTVATEIIKDLKRVGLKMELTATSLRRGYGNPLCIVLNKLLSYVMKKKGFSFQKKIEYQSRYLLNSQKETAEREDEELDIEEDIGFERDQEDEEEDDEIDYSTFINQGKFKSEEKNRFGDLNKGKNQENRVSVQDWLLELEQISPQLVVRLSVDLKNWRTHVDSMVKQETTINNLFNETTKNLQKISERVSAVLIRIRKREAMLNNDPQISKLLVDLKNFKDELTQIEQKYKVREEANIKLSDELNRIDQELNEVKRAASEKEKEFSDPTKVNNIKDSIAKISQEIKELDLRSGVLQHSLLQAKVKHRIQSSRSQTTYKGEKNQVY